ncbi:DUF262 domain-containing protein [Phytohabitans sp. ZYX-F-186]|uniref:DUF262 domain-containing protein n=1 Tax=Phytohabitans maris TaxID=3071409 RepID=A0ABU0ZNF9_9ACTN|nr:DUF262 domain-containing protein [Phytohabitans sp. ZYX-F-186]MDQ7908579.1 DUF262 domain-containing protein [Phytohabitans sp. ZYX-F-186]
MHVEKTERSVGELIDQIGRAEIKLPELQRDFVWKPTQIAKLMDSLYRSFPSGSLLFWQAEDAPVVREMAITDVAVTPVRPPLYLLDGQQRLTSLHRVFADHPDAQIVFNIERERFQNQSAATRQDPRWIKLSEVLDPKASMLRLTKRLIDAGSQLEDTEIEQRLGRIRQFREHRFHMEILKGFPYETVAEIFVRVNSGGRRLGTLDLAMATLSARWPGVLEKLQGQADYWRRQGYADIDVNFLSRALAGVVLGGGLSGWSHGRLATASDEDLDQGWATVCRGLRHVAALLRANLKLTGSGPLPSMLALIPLVVFLGERPDAPLDKELSDGVIYWLLVATMQGRYGGSTDTTLSRDIRAARRPDPMQALLGNLDLLTNTPQVTVQSLTGRTKESPYAFLSLLAAQLNGARDWWYGTEILPGADGDRKLETHHVHPMATLDGQYDKTEINDLANLVFISGRANRRIGTKTPAEYFPQLDVEELTAHLIPLTETLWKPEAYPAFLEERRRLLAASMNQLLAQFRPTWLDRLPTSPAAPIDGYALSLVLYASTWDPGRLLFTASGDGIRWTGSAAMAEFQQAITDASVVGIDGDVRIAGETVPVQVVEEAIQVQVGPFLVTGTPDQWRQVIERESTLPRPLSTLPSVPEAPWLGAPPITFPVTSTE